jgi:hypothetical protein
MLTDLTGFRNLDTVTTVINIDNNDNLTNFSPFNKITTVEYLLIKNNGSLTNLQGFTNLQTVTVWLAIENNSALINFQGLSRLKSVARLEILRNASLVNFVGLDSLSAIVGNGYSITIWSNSQLQNLNGLQNLTTAEGSVQISVNSMLTDFCGLKPLFAAGYNGFFVAQGNASNPTKSQILNNCP